MMEKENEKRPLLTKQDIKDFGIAAVLTGGLEVLLKPTGAPLGAGELALSVGLWGGVIGFMRGRRQGKEAGFRAGAASAAGAAVGNITGYLINNYELLMPYFT